MGFKISWVGFHGQSKREVLELVGAVDTGVIDEANEAPFSGAEIPGGWFILFSNDFGFVSKELLESLSVNGTVVVCQVHEGVMVSAAYVYEMQRRAADFPSAGGLGIKKRHVFTVTANLHSRCGQATIDFFRRPPPPIKTFFVAGSRSLTVVQSHDQSDRIASRLGKRH